MIRLLAAVLVLCTQVLAVFGTGNLVVCIQDDGKSAIEFAGSPCCRAAHEAERRASRDDAKQTVTVSPPDNCTDVPYTSDHTFVAPGAQRRSEMHHVARTAPLAIVAWTPSVAAVWTCESHRFLRGPPREAVPRPAISFVRRC